MMLSERLIKHLGRDFSEEERLYYYDYIENFIEKNVDRSKKSPDTDRIANDFAKEIKEFGKSEFIFLLLCSGYIPEIYSHDSSEETLYTKLVEVLVCEWAFRIGFKDSKIQKQKGSKEDVTIQLANSIIVCDAKSFRLGRSQAAPNVKDTIKKADYLKWQENYKGESYDGDILYSTIGGLITFPSLHRWKGNSDAYYNCTHANDPILILFYEHMGFMLAHGFNHENIIDVLSNFGELFPETTKSQHEYFQKVTERLFGKENEDLTDFFKMTIELMEEMVSHKLQLVQTYIQKGTKRIEEEVSSLEDLDVLRERLTKAEITLFSKQFQKQVTNIKTFRVSKESKKTSKNTQTNNNDSENTSGSLEGSED